MLGVGRGGSQLHLSDLVKNYFSIRVKRPPAWGELSPGGQGEPPQMQLPDNSRTVARKISGCLASTQLGISLSRRLESHTFVVKVCYSQIFPLILSGKNV